MCLGRGRGRGGGFHRPAHGSGSQGGKHVRQIVAVQCAGGAAARVKVLVETLRAWAMRGLHEVGIRRGERDGGQSES